MYPATHDFLLRAYEPVKAGQARLVDVIVGFIDPNAPDVIAQPQNPTKLEIVEAEAESETRRGGRGRRRQPKRRSTPGPDPEEAARRFASIARLHQHSLSAHRQARRA